ncbi:MAG TPA: NUDIX hydrolase [Dehalococcoidia bacterium]|nr:NUDIX hydrolase [Dehalococcoidia bacterium]
MTLVPRASRRLRIEDLVSAGGIVYQRNEDGPRVVLVGRLGEGLWGLPKGTPIEGESIEETATREVREETGLEVEIERSVGSIEYWFTRLEQGIRFHKIVHHFLMTPTGGALDKHDHEYDVAEWVPAHAAVDRLTYRNEADLLRRVLTLLRGGESSLPASADR